MKDGVLKKALLLNLIIIAISVFTLSIVSAQILNAELTVTKTGTPSTQTAPGTITWNVTVQNTGNVALTGVNVTDSKHGYLGSFGVLNPGDMGWFTIVESNLPPDTYTDQAFAAGYYKPSRITALAWSDIVECVVTQPKAELTVTKTGTPSTQTAPGTITWNVTVENTGDVTLTGINVTDSQHGYLGSFGVLNPGDMGWFTIVESDLSPGIYYDNATAFGKYQNSTVSDWDDACARIYKQPPDFVVPEIPFGPVMVLVSSMTGLILFKKKSTNA